MIKTKWIISILIILIFFSCGGGRSSFILVEGDRMETPGFIIDSGKSGPLVYIIAGIHGNEPAGPLTADSLNDIELDNGSLVVLPRANLPALDAVTRTLPSLGDLNRAFPGKVKGREVDEMANAVMTHIDKMNPVIVIDLHESRDRRLEETYAVGNSLIGSHSQVIDLLQGGADILNEGSVGPYAYFFDILPGTINTEVSQGLDIPVITMETDVDLPLDKRIADQQKLIGYVLNYFGLLVTE